MHLRLAVAAVCVLALPASAAPARDGGDRPEVRAAGTCGGGVKAKVKARARDGRLELELEVEHAPRGSAWRVTIAQEGRVVWRGRARAADGRFRVRRLLRDYAGADRLRVRASGPGGPAPRAGT